MKATQLYNIDNGVSHPVHGEGFIYATGGRSDPKYGVQFAHGVEWLHHDTLTPCPKAARIHLSRRKHAMNAGYEAAQQRKAEKKALTAKKKALR